MPKRKSNYVEDEVDNLYRKLRKLQKKIDRYDRYRSSSPPSDRFDCDRSQRSISPFAEVFESDEEQRNTRDEEMPQEEPVASQVVRSKDQNQAVNNIVTVTTEDESIDPEILNILGEDPSERKDYGDDLQKDIAARWSHMLINGIPKETKADIVKTYLPAKNCINMKAPKLNLEIEAALSPINLKKDQFSQAKQNYLACALSAIGKVLKSAISSKLDQDVVKPLSDAGRLLCDLHYRESISRRFTIMGTLNKQTKDTIKNTKIDEFLFGGNLNEHLKSSKAISRSGLEMKSAVQRPPFKPIPGPSNARGALNSRGMTRATAGEPRQNPVTRKPAPARQDRRQEANFRRNNSARQRTYYRRQ